MRIWIAERAHIRKVVFLPSAPCSPYHYRMKSSFSVKIFNPGAPRAAKGGRAATKQSKRYPPQKRQPLRGNRGTEERFSEQAVLKLLPFSLRLCASARFKTDAAAHPNHPSLRKAELWSTESSRRDAKTQRKG